MRAIKHPIAQTNENTAIIENNLSQITASKCIIFNCIDKPRNNKPGNGRTGQCPALDDAQLAPTRKS